MNITEDQALQNFIRYKSDPWEFLCDCVFTLDQVDEKNPVKKFPVHRTYLKLFVRLWQKYPHIAVPKSRRMTMSWTLIALHLWDTMFHKGKFIAFVSKKEEDAGELVSRAEFIYNHIPADKIPKELLPKIRGGSMKKKPPVLDFWELSSKIQGFPMGADQLRQFTFSRIMGDETAFWPNATEFYSAAKPTLDGGGRMTLVSSVAPGFFKKLVFDTLNSELDSDLAPAGAEVKVPMEGVRVWLNPDNRFLIIEIHYTADTAKRSPEFKQMLKASLPRRQYLQEYELNWDTFEGLPVYADFGERHLLHVAPEPSLGLPLIVGWDFGLTPSAIVTQLQGDQLVILREFVAKNEAINTFAPKVVSQLRILYPEWNDTLKDFRHYIDPAGFHRSETDARTCAQVMEDEAGIRNIFPGAPLSNAFEPRKNAVVQRLIKFTKQGPAIVMHEGTSQMIVKGFRGGYQYPESFGEIEPDKLRPLKNTYSHPHDALQYACWGVADLVVNQIKTIPTPRYKFQGETEKDTGAIAYGYKEKII